MYFTDTGYEKKMKFIRIFFVEIKNSRISFFHTIRQMQKKHQKIPGAKLLLFTTYTTFSFTAF